tara:strand:- start:58 stop:1335 length:1278 start_codon:yes stop_codon:yes gene_type:complete
MYQNQKEQTLEEHHKKDADGNTIPHEGEELDENLASIAAKGLQMASRGASKVSQMAAKGSVRAKQLQAQGGVKKAVGDKLQSAKKKLALTSGQKEALLGRTTAGKITRGVGALAAANVAGRMSGGDKPSSGYSSYNMNFHYVPDGDTISEDLFDSLKSALIEQGCDEKNVMKVMSSITPDFINETIQEENLDEAIFTTGAILAAKLAAKALAKKAVVGATKMAMKKGTTAAATKLVGKVGTKKAAGMVAKKAAVGTGKAMVKNPVNTALAGSMIMPQGGGGAAPQPQTTQRGVTSGKRTAGVQRMDLDLFDVVKGQLLDEGLTEEECNDVMTTLTLEEINETLQLDEISGKLAMKASRAADMKRAQLAKAGDKAGAAAKASQSSRLYQGGAKRNIAKQDLSKPLNPQRKDYPMGKGGSYQEKPSM